MGVSISRLPYIYSDNFLKICNTQKPEPTLKKKTKILIWYYLARKLQWGFLATHIPTNENVMDLLVKVLNGAKLTFGSECLKQFL